MNIKVKLLKHKTTPKSIKTVRKTEGLARSKVTGDKILPFTELLMMTIPLVTTTVFRFDFYSITCICHTRQQCVYIQLRCEAVFSGTNTGRYYFPVTI